MSAPSNPDTNSFSEPTEPDAASRKRHAIQDVMRDRTLTPQERNRRIQQIMAGRVDLEHTAPNDSHHDGENGSESNSPDMAAAEDGASSSDQTESDAAKQKRRAIQKLMQDRTLTPQERNQRIQQIMAGSLMNDVDPSSRRGNQALTDTSGTFSRLSTMEDDVAAKVRKSELSFDREEQEDFSAVVDDDRYALTEINNSAANNVLEADKQNSTSVLLDEDGKEIRESHRTGPPVTSYRPMPLPGEQFSNMPPQSQGEILEFSPSDQHDDINHGLAVATAVAPDDEPEYVYNAIEYDPESKPPLHQNRRFRIYTCAAFFLISVTVIMIVVYLTASTRREEIVEKSIQLEDLLTQEPTLSPTTAREASGVREQLETGVLSRNETFAEMQDGDPRLLALDWILNVDGMRLVSDDTNLHQRFALSVVAFQLDSFAWYLCGPPLSLNFTENECNITDPNTNITESSGVWLSSMPECSWYGVRCSQDGVVREIELISNDLVGVLPHELASLSYLQLLALQGNCIFGTIPPELGRLSHLQSLELHYNGLSGEMPTEIYDLKHLQLLNLAQQYGIEAECQKSDGTLVNIFFQMGGLGDTPKFNSGLSGKLDVNIGRWRSMKGLYLFQNSFSGTLAPAIGNLRYLTFLRINDNFISGPLPEEISELGNLRELRIEENFFHSALPQNLGNMKDLEILTVSENSMYGPIPDSLYDLKKLKILRLDDTLMANEPWTVTSDEGFTGSLSSRVGELQDLQVLFLNSNPLTGSIPTELGLCENLQIFRAHRTLINGTMPLEVCMLRDKNLNNEEGIGVLYSDCRPNNRTGNPYLKCDCCSDCCDHTTEICTADD